MPDKLMSRTSWLTHSDSPVHQSQGDIRMINGTAVPQPASATGLWHFNLAEFMITITFISHTAFQASQINAVARKWGETEENRSTYPATWGTRSPKPSVPCPDNKGQMLNLTETPTGTEEHKGRDGTSGALGHGGDMNT